MQAGDRSIVERRAEALHRARWGCPSECTACAPGRVNLIGDHVDYAGGPVMPMPIAAVTVAAISHAHGDGGDEFASEWEVDAAWMRYASGTLVELRKSGVAVPAVRVAIASDVPVGAGLSSSAALEVAVARGALLLAGTTLDARTIAFCCQRAEHVHAGMPCGIMDQWCVAHAAEGSGPRRAVLLDCGTLDALEVAIPVELELEIVDSGVRHALRDGGYASRRADVEEAARLLGVDLLARLPAARLGEIESLPPRIARCARHVVGECARVRAAAAALGTGDLEGFGRLLDESHASLRDDFDVSTPELDAIVDRARRDGALGARMTGGGFGGCAVIARRRAT